MKPITIETTISAPKQKNWENWNETDHITGWAFTSDDWEAPADEATTPHPPYPVG